MKKALAFALFTLCLALGLSGCGAKITSVTMTPRLTLAAGGMAALEVDYRPDRAVDGSGLQRAIDQLAPVFSSNDKTVAVVDADGVVYAVGVGEAVITLTAPGGLSADCIVTVGAPLGSLRVAEDLELTLGGAGDEAQLEVVLEPADAAGVELTYRSADASVAAVDAAGTVRAVGVGECEIIVRAVSVVGETTAAKEAAVKVKVTDADPGAALPAASAQGEVPLAAQSPAQGGSAPGPAEGAVEGAAAPAPAAAACFYCGGSHAASACPLYCHHGRRDNAGHHHSHCW